MFSETPLHELLAFFKALSNANRLKIVGLLAQGEYTVEQLAALLELGPSTVSHHLARLSGVQLVSARAEGYYSVYRLEPRILEDMARRLLASDQLPQMAADVDLDAYDRKVLRDFSNPDGSLKSIPAQHKKLQAILQALVDSFEVGRRYSEQEVNHLLARFHPDTARLRRELIGAGLLARERNRYWRVE